MAGSDELFGRGRWSDLSGSGAARAAEAYRREQDGTYTNHENTPDVRRRENRQSNFEKRRFRDRSIPEKVLLFVGFGVMLAAIVAAQLGAF